MTTPLWILAGVSLFLALTIVRVVRSGRTRAIARLRGAWGTPVARTHKMDGILASHQSRAAAFGETCLDDRTWADLNLDAVFESCDRTESTLGQHALYHRLRSAPTGAHSGAFEALVTRFSEDAAAREHAQLALARLQDPQGYDLWWAGQPDLLDSRPWHIVFPMLGLAALGLAAALPFRPALLPLLFGVVVVSLIIRFSTDRRVLHMAAAFRQFAPVIATGQALAFLDGDAIEPLVSPLRADASRLTRLKTIARWVSGDPFMLSVRTGGFAMLATDVANVVYDYLNVVFLLDANGVYFGAQELRMNGQALLRVIQAAGDVDAAISVASWRAGLQAWTRPRVLPRGSGATLTDAWHPLVAGAVPNTITMAAGSGVLVTGSNMSGKSTLLRTVGVNAVLAQTVHTCLATEYAAPIFHVRSCIGRSDDLLSGKSYYLVEVESLVALMRASTGEPPHLFLLDEMFRGTNAVERIAAGQAVLRELAGSGGAPRHVVMAATHDGELVDLLPDLFAAVHFGDSLGDDGLVFDYRLRPGRATTRNAIALLHLNGAPTRVVEDATACATGLDAARALHERAT